MKHRYLEDYSKLRSFRCVQSKAKQFISSADILHQGNGCVTGSEDGEDMQCYMFEKSSREWHQMLTSRARVVSERNITERFQKS